MLRLGVLTKIVVALLPAMVFGIGWFAGAGNADEGIAIPATPLIAQLQPDTGDDRIISWYGYELKHLGSSRLGVYPEDGGDLVDVKTCGCSGGDGSCRLIVAEVPHYSFCVASEGDPCSGACAFK